MPDSNFVLINRTQTKVPRRLFSVLKRMVLGAKYHLDVAFETATTARALNRTYRKKTYTPNVLAFPLTQKTGTIVLCSSVARTQARSFGYTNQTDYLTYLFIHGLLHLKGYRHGSTMERKEAALCTRVGLRPPLSHTHGTKHFSRSRHWNLTGQSNGRRGRSTGRSNPA